MTWSENPVPRMLPIVYPSWCFTGGCILWAGPPASAPPLSWSEGDSSSLWSVVPQFWKAFSSLHFLSLVKYSKLPPLLSTYPIPTSISLSLICLVYTGLKIFSDLKSFITQNKHRLSGKFPQLFSSHCHPPTPSLWSISNLSSILSEFILLLSKVWPSACTLRPTLFHLHRVLSRLII